MDKNQKKQNLENKQVEKVHYIITPANKSYSVGDRPWIMELRKKLLESSKKSKESNENAEKK